MTTALARKEDGPSISLTPPMVVKLLSVVSVGAGMLFLVWSLTRFNELTRFGIAVMGAATVLFVGIGIDGFQRRYAITVSEVRIRIMFVWRTLQLPSQVTVKATPGSQVQLLCARTERVVVRIPREYNSANRLADRLRPLFARESSPV